MDYVVALVVVGSSLGVDLTPLCIDMRTLLCYHSNIHPSAYSLSVSMVVQNVTVLYTARGSRL